MTFHVPKKKETTHEKKIPCVLIPLSVSWPAFGPQSGELPLYQDENMRQKTNSLLTVRVSWWAFWSWWMPELLEKFWEVWSPWKLFFRGRRGLFVNTQLKVGIRWEQQVSTQALSTAIGLSKTFLKRKLQGDAIPWGKNKYTMIYGSEISQLRYISNFSKNGSCSHEDNWRCFFGFQGGKSLIQSWFF